MTLEELHNDFLNTWPLSRLETLTLEEYNKQGSKDSFCYWVEYGTKPLANISGIMGSPKFEIYERKPGAKLPTAKRYGHDSKYTWLNRAGVVKSRDEAFEYTKKEILEIVRHSIAGNFHLINERALVPLFIWKIAFLYSGNELLSFADRKVVRYLAELFDMNISKSTTTVQMHQYLMGLVSKESYWDDMRTFWQLHNDRNRAENPNESAESLLRRGVKLKDIKESLRKSSLKQVTISKRHNKLQQKIHDELVAQGYDAIMEENNIDIKVEHPDRVDFYEVKITNSAKNCIRQALGQIIEYSYDFNSEKNKRLIIVGNHPLTEADESYVNFLKHNLLLPFEFEYQCKN